MLSAHNGSEFKRKNQWPLLAGSSPSLPDGSNPSAAIVQSASDVQCSRLLKTTVGPELGILGRQGATADDAVAATRD
ncbi:hypothetical protein D7H65_29650 [Pseudomonas aeruginosa]|nr:hypothetical protein D7H65_29650 [Pseudomonas aeruginosa]